MSNNGNNERRAARLGMPWGTANARLRKNILFKYVVKAGDNFCFKCGAEIESVDDLSIEHKLPWEGRDTELFWDLDNIAFSHLKCNRPEVQRGGKPSEHIPPTPDLSWCAKCCEFKPVSEFWKGTGSNGLQQLCKSCHSADRRERRHRISN